MIFMLRNYSSKPLIYLNGIRNYTGRNMVHLVVLFKVVMSELRYLSLHRIVPQCREIQTMYRQYCITDKDAYTNASK